MEQNIQLQDIDASLTYGQIFSGKAWNGIIIFLYVLTGIAATLMLAWLIGVPLTMGKYDSNDVAFLIAGPCFVVIMVVILISLQMFFNKGKKKAALWLKDAVILDAQAKSLGQTLHVRNLIMRTATAIEVSFEYDDKRCVRQSTYKDKPLYLAVYTKYVDKKILIAYSPKYDEVMLIKPQSAQRIKDSNNNTK